MFVDPASQAFFPGPNEGDALPTMPHHSQYYSIFDDPFLASQAFIDSTVPRLPLKLEAQEEQFSAFDDGSWRDADGCAEAALNLSVLDYGQQSELGTASWTNSHLHASTLNSLAELDCSELYTLPQGVYSQYQAMDPMVRFGMSLSPASTNWFPDGLSPHGVLGAEASAMMQEATPRSYLDDGFPHFTYEPQPLESEAKSLFSGAMLSHVLPQAVYQPAPLAPSVASSPAFEGLSSAASLAVVSALSDVYVASPVSSSSSGASDSAGSPVSVRGSPAKCRKTTPTKGKTPNTRSRATRRRTRLPSVAQSASSPASTASTASTWSRPPARKRGQAKSRASRTPVTRGRPYRRIQDMDDASRAELDRILVAFRASGTPYKIIMDRLRHIYHGNHNTLRGRLRTLTLSPNMRVRNPVWEDHHIELLKEAVARESCKNPSTHRISWTRVSEYMHDRTGPGSYKFSVTACSRKWQDLVDEDEVEDEE